MINRDIKAITQTNELTLQDIARLTHAFESKQWSGMSEMGESIFDTFCKMLSSMSHKEIELMLELTEDFLWINESQYIHHFGIALNQLAAELGTEQKRTTIIFCPLLPEEDFLKSKSSLFLLYIIKAFLQPMQQKHPQLNLTIIEHPSGYDETIFGDHYLCLVDDFIGSGQTAEAAMSYFVTKGINQERIIILSLVAMKTGIESIKRSGVNAYAGMIVDKGIAYKEDAEEKYKIMKAIEDRIGVKEQYRFGYEQSEALVKMVRTPNNTFPVYWLKSKKNPYCPFPR